MEKSNISFASGEKFIESMRHQGLSDGDAIKELVDNSLDAKSEHIHINIEKGANGINILVQDDGIGMDRDLLERAPSFGNSGIDSGGRIGRFGFGLPTAITSKTRHAELFSKTKDGKWNYTYVDLDEIAASADLKLPRALQKSPSELLAGGIQKYETGTIVILKDCDRMDHEKVDTILRAIKDDLEITYCYFIADGMEMTLNGERLELNDPLMLLKDHKYVKDLREGLKKEELTDTTGYAEQIGEIEDIPNENGSKSGRARIKLTLLPIKDIERTGKARKYGIGLKEEGFYLVRNKRIISGAQTLGCFTPHPMLTYFRGEIDFDSDMDEDFGIQVNKSRFRLSKSMQDKIYSRVRELINTIRQKQYDTMHELHQDRNGGAAEEIALSVPLRTPKEIKTATEEDVEKAIEEESKQIESNSMLSSEEKEKQIEDIKKSLENAEPYIIATENNRQGPIFVWEYLGKSTKLIINRDHPFYKYVWLALSDEKCPTDYRRTVLSLFLFTLVKGEQIHRQELEDGNVIGYQELQALWSMTLRKLLTSDKFLKFYDEKGLEDDYES